MKREIEVTLFGVEHDGDLKREYRELAEIDEFKDLKPKQVRFCWLVGNRTSPIFKMDREDRIKKALTIVWGRGYSSRAECKELMDGADGFPDEIIKGIHKMNTFSPEFRLKAKLMNEYIFETLNEIVVLDDHSIRSMDIDERKKYADFVIKVSSGLQEMVERLEGSYGVELTDRKTKQEVNISIGDVL